MNLITLLQFLYQTNSVPDDFAIPIQFFIGKGDFFFCHWMAIDEQSIIDRLSSVGSDEYFITLVTNIDKPKMNVEAILPLINKLN